MAYHKTEAIILDTADVFDADRSLLMFTRQLGKLRARARGVRKPTSKLTGHLLSYIPTEIELNEGLNGSFIVTSAQVLPGYAEMGSYPNNALLFSAQAAIVVEAINRLYTDTEPHPTVYDGLSYTLDRLRVLSGDTSDPVKARLVVAEFLLKALSELGYRAELQECVVTGKPVSEEFVGWNSQLGGLVTKEGYDASQGSARRVEHPRAIVLLRQFQKPQFAAERIQVDSEVANEACQLVYDYVQTQIGQPLRSLQSV